MRNSVMRSDKIWLPSREALRVEIEDEETKAGEKGGDRRTASEAEQRCLIECGAQACSRAKTTLRFWVCVTRQVQCHLP